MSTKKVAISKEGKEPSVAETENDVGILDFAHYDDAVDEEDEEEEEEEDDEDEDPKEPAEKRQRFERKVSRQIELPLKQTLSRANDIREAILTATGNSRGGWSTFDTFSSPPMHEIFLNELDISKKCLDAGKPRDAFCISVALYLNMIDFNMWYCDTEEHETVQNIFTSFHKLLVKIFENDDAVLGLKGREVFISELKKLGKFAKEGFEYKFTWFETEG